MKRTNGPRCECGCGKFVKMGRYGWNRFLPGHNFKIPLTPQQEEDRRKKISKTMKTWLANSPEEREKRRQIWTGRTHSEETKKKLSILRSGEGNGMYGKKLSAKRKEEISKFWKGREFSKETLKKISDGNRGKIRSEEFKKRLSESLKEHYKNNPSKNIGRIVSEETREKIRKANLKYRGELASNWRGGISSFPYDIDWNKWLRIEIKNRDRNKCQNPKCTKISKILDVHHIDYDKNNSNPNNLITLCKSCHGKTQHHRRTWKRYYKSIMLTK